VLWLIWQYLFDKSIDTILWCCYWYCWIHLLLPLLICCTLMIIVFDIHLLIWYLNYSYVICCTLLFVVVVRCSPVTLCLVDYYYWLFIGGVVLIWFSLFIYYLLCWCCCYFAIVSVTFFIAVTDCILLLCYALVVFSVVVRYCYCWCCILLMSHLRLYDCDHWWLTTFTHFLVGVRYSYLTLVFVDRFLYSSVMCRRFWVIACCDCCEWYCDLFIVRTFVVISDICSHCYCTDDSVTFVIYSDDWQYFDVDYVVVTLYTFIVVLYLLDAYCSCWRNDDDLSGVLICCWWRYVLMVLLWIVCCCIVDSLLLYCWLTLMVMLLCYCVVCLCYLVLICCCTFVIPWYVHFGIPLFCCYWWMLLFRLPFDCDGGTTLLLLPLSLLLIAFFVVRYSGYIGRIVLLLPLSYMLIWALLMIRSVMRALCDSSRFIRIDDALWCGDLYRDDLRLGICSWYLYGVELVTVWLFVFWVYYSVFGIVVLIHWYVLVSLIFVVVDLCWELCMLLLLFLLIYSFTDDTFTVSTDDSLMMKIFIFTLLCCLFLLLVLLIVVTVFTRYFVSLLFDVVDFWWAVVEGMCYCCGYDVTCCWSCCCYIVVVVIVVR